MEIKNLFKKISFGLICFLLLMSVGINIFQYQKMKKANPEAGQDSLVNSQSVGNETPQKNNTQSAKLSAIGKEPNKNEVDELSYQLEAAEEELDLAYKQISELAYKNKDTNTVAGPMADMMDRMSDPQKKEELKTSLKRGFNQQYGTLFKLLNLSPEKLRQFKELLANQTMEMMKIANDVETVEPSEENRNKLQERLDDFLKQREADLTSFLGSQDYQIYKNYKDSQQERGIVQRFTFSLSAEDKLTNEQQEALINSMYQERKNVSWIGNAGQSIFFPSDLEKMQKSNDENMKEAKEMEEQIKDAYLESTGDILTASQQEHFEEYFQQANAMMSLPALDPTAQDDTEEGQGPTIIFNLC